MFYNIKMGSVGGNGGEGVYLIILYAREGRMGLMGRDGVDGIDGANGLMGGRESRSQTFYMVGENVFQDGGEICRREWEGMETKKEF